MNSHCTPSVPHSRLGAVLTLALILFTLLLPVGAWLFNDDADSHSRQCPGPAVGSVDPVACVPYVPGVHGPAPTNHPGSSARQPAQRPKAPAVKVPAAPPRISTGKR